MRKKIVISAVNLIEAGTLAILKDCLGYLSRINRNNEYQIIAIIHDKNLINLPNIDYIETTWPKKNWLNRIWFEYISLYKISQKIGSIDLWFSLHDTSPRVIANRQVVYCHNAFFSYKWSFKDLFFAPKIAFFAVFTKYIYRFNISSNAFLVVQQQWFKEAMNKMYSFPKANIIVAPPKNNSLNFIAREVKLSKTYSFIFVGSPNSHKNFEIICLATKKLLNAGISNFEIYFTFRGDENKYAKYIYSSCKNLPNIHFLGKLDKNVLNEYYNKCDCLIFPSKIESWGLPISEFSLYNKPMLLADLPYAHETAAGSKQICFFDQSNSNDLANKMEKLINGNKEILTTLSLLKYSDPIANNWDELFQILLSN